MPNLQPAVFHPQYKTGEVGGGVEEESSRLCFHNYAPFFYSVLSNKQSSSLMNPDCFSTSGEQTKGEEPGMVCGGESRRMGGDREGTGFTGQQGRGFFWRGAWVGGGGGAKSALSSLLLFVRCLIGESVFVGAAGSV